MSTDTRSLPICPTLELRLIMAGVQALRYPRPLYRALFRIAICNRGNRPLRILGRKWTLRELNGSTRIIEADKIFGTSPLLIPGAVFATSGSQEFDTPPIAMELRLFGADEFATPFISEPLRFPRNCFRH